MIKYDHHTALSHDLPVHYNSPIFSSFPVSPENQKMLAGSMPLHIRINLILADH